MQPQRTGGRGPGLPTGGAASMLEIPKVNAIHTESAAAIRSDFIILILLVKPSAGSFYSIPASAVNALLFAAITSRLWNGVPVQRF